MAERLACCMADSSHVALQCLHTYGEMSNSVCWRGVFSISICNLGRHVTSSWQMRTRTLRVKGSLEPPLEHQEVVRAEIVDPTAVLSTKPTHEPKDPSPYPSKRQSPRRPALDPTSPTIQSLKSLSPGTPQRILSTSCVRTESLREDLVV